MKKFITFILIVFAMYFAMSAYQPQQTDFLGEVNPVNKAATLFLDCGITTGTGIVVTDQMVFTAFHVVEDVSSCTIETRDGAKVSVYVVNRDPFNDFAILMTAKSVFKDAYSINCGMAEQGVTYHAAGYPAGRGLTIVKITPRAEYITIAGRNPSDAFRGFDGKMRPGMSGGPVVTPDGSVIGFISARLADDAKVGLVKEMVDTAICEDRH